MDRGKTQIAGQAGGCRTCVDPGQFEGDQSRRQVMFYPLVYNPVTGQIRIFLFNSSFTFTDEVSTA